MTQHADPKTVVAELRRPNCSDRSPIGAGWNSSILDGNMLREGAQVQFVKVYDERKGKERAEQVTGGIGEAEVVGGTVVPLEVVLVCDNGRQAVSEVQALPSSQASTSRGVFSQEPAALHASAVHGFPSSQVPTSKLQV